MRKIYEKSNNIIEKNNEKTNYKILSNCKDFQILQENLSEDILQEIENQLEHYENYQCLYDDEKEDIIEEYKKNYGANNVINWYEGVMPTDYFIESLNYSSEKVERGNEYG